MTGANIDFDQTSSGQPIRRSSLEPEPRLPSDPRLDLIAIGRSSVDLYGAQVGGRLEDMASFSKAVGGCPTNIAIGTARLGLKSGLITRVGDEHMGRFIREQCAREGVDVAGVRTDPGRLTSLVILGIRDDKTFPLIFYRDNCADSALDESDIDEAYIASAKAIVVTGTHFARRRTHAAAQRLRPCASPGSTAARSSSTSTIARTSGAWPDTAPAKSATSSRARSTQSLQRDPAAMRSHRRHRGGVDDRRRRRRSARRAESGARAQPGDDRA